MWQLRTFACSLFLLTGVVAAQTPASAPETAIKAPEKPDLVRGLRKRPVSCFPSMLSSYNIEDSAEGVLMALARPEPIVRITALCELASRGLEEHIPSVLPLLNDPDTSVRQFAVMAVNRLVYGIPEDRTVEARARALATARDLYRNAKSLLVQVQVADLLAEAGDPAGYTAIIEGLQSRYPGQAMNAVNRFLRFDLRDRDGKPVDWVQPVARVLQDTTKSYTVRSVAVGVLQRIGTPAALDVLRAWSGKEPNEGVRLQIKYILEPPRRHTAPDRPVRPAAG